MQANVGRETSLEGWLRELLSSNDLKFRTDCAPEPELKWKADAVIHDARVCIFVDGCFWHGCRWHFRPPKTNRAWWIEKIHANVDRDRRQTILLRRRGWTVLRIWEHSLTASRGRSAALVRLRRVLG